MVSKWLRRTHVRQTVFVGVVVLLAWTFCWLGWQVLAQDQQLAQQRVAEDREIAADLAVAAFNQRLSSIERALDSALSRGDFAGNESQAEGVLVRISHDDVHTRPPGVLRYYPRLPQRATTPEAEALVRRAQRALNAADMQRALDTYDQLERLGPVPIGDVVGGIPAALFAHLGRLIAFERQRDRARSVTAARALEAALLAGRWRISAATYQFLDEQVRRVVEARSRADTQLAVAEALTWLWEERTSDSLFPPSGRVSRVFASGPALIVWRSSSEAVVALIANLQSLNEVWIPALAPFTQSRRARMAISTPEGQPIVGSIAPADRPAVRLASATTLPWTIQVTNTADERALRARRRLFVAGMAVLLALIAGGAWLIERTIARELAVADLQSDFVSGVSHEFRTPLTTLCQLSEMLLRGRVASEADRRQYYQLLNVESHRLRRLVETLLNFGRLDAGRMDFRFADVDVGLLVRNTVAEFEASPQARAHRVELAVDGVSIAARGDGEMLKTVLWNLLENAAKYSPNSHTISVAVKAHDRALTFSVRDRGVGIPRREQRQVFEKFVRGAGARASGIGGTGVGLSVARRIVDAHGGDITLESQVGTGSTFTVTLPLLTSPLPNPNRQSTVAAG